MAQFKQFIKTLLPLCLLLMLISSCIQLPPLKRVDTPTVVDKGGSELLINGDELLVNNSGLKTYRLNDGVPDSLLSSYSSDNSANRLNLFDDKLVMASDSSGIEIIDINSKQILNSDYGGEYALSAVGYDNYVYVVTGTNINTNFDGLIIYDISIPSKPIEVNRIPNLGHTNSSTPLLIEDGYLFIPELVKTAGGWNKYLLHVYDLSTPANPKKISTFQDDFLQKPSDIILSGNFLFISSIGSGLLVLDVSDLTSLIEAGRFEFSGSNRSLAIDGNYAYLLDVFNLLTLDVSDVGHIKRIALNEMQQATEVVADELIYVIDNSELKIFSPPFP